MQVRANRKTERAAVNAARSLFESWNCVFQEVDLGNDYGKDAYVDLAEGDVLSGLCVALQIKGGKSYRRSGSYAIRVDEAHARIWRASSVPVAGIVHDPDDGRLRWCNISAFLADCSGENPTTIPVSADHVLEADSLEEFRNSFRSLERVRSAGLALLQLTSTDPAIQVSAMSDCFALGRSDARVLILLRHLLGVFTDERLRLAVRILAHATPHPDIFWHKGNWISEDICKAVTAHFNWSESEIACLMTAIPQNEWQRGCPGQDLYSILCKDSDIEKKMGEVARSALLNGNESLAYHAMYLTIYWARNEGLEMYQGFLAMNRGFQRLAMSEQLDTVLKAQGRVTLFE